MKLIFFCWLEACSLVRTLLIVLKLEYFVYLVVTCECLVDVMISLVLISLVLLSLPAEECHGLVAFLVERHGQVVVLRHERSLENLINALYPVSSLSLRLSRELVGSLWCVKNESESLFSESGTKARHNEEARAGVSQEYLSLGVRVQRLHVIHQLPAPECAPPLLVDISGTGSSLVKVTFSCVVL